MLAEKLTRILSSKSWYAIQSVKCIPRTIVRYNIPFSTSNLSFQKENVNSKLFHISKKNNSSHAECSHAYKILRHSKVYSKSLATQLSTKKKVQIDKAESSIQKTWISMTNVELLENFEILSHYAFQNHENSNETLYRGILEVLTTRCPDLSNDELKHLLRCLKLWNIKDNEFIYKGLCEELDKECLKRMANWSIEEIFLMNDYFYKASLHTFTSFPVQSLRKLDALRMTPENIVQYAFLLKVNERTQVHFYDFENQVEKYADKFSLEELGIISMAFFKYEIRIKKKIILDRLITELQANIDNVSDITLASILKILRYSIDLTTIEQYQFLLKSLVNQISRCTLATVTHIAHMQAMILLQNDELVSEILEKYKREIKKARLKDIERILFTLYIFNYKPESTSFYSSAINELLQPSRASEIQQYPKSLIYSILYALEVNYYSEEALKQIMTPEFIQLSCRNQISTLDREYLMLDYCLEIDHPEYDGPRLRKDLVLYLVKKCGVLLRKERMKYQKVDQATKLLIDVAHTCKEVLDAELSVHVDALLPHVPRQDIVMCYDPETKEFCSPVEKISDMPVGTIKYAPKDGLKWIVIVTATHNLLTRNTLQPTGILALTLRHLERIGYSPIVISYVDWQNLKDVTHKRKFIANKLLSL